MKKYFYLAGLMLAIISLSACQKDLTESEETPTGGSATISRTVYAGDEDWQGALDVRSAYDPDLDKVKLDGTEQMAVFFRYKDGAGAESKLNGVTSSNPLLATSTGGREYTFSHEATAEAVSYSYYFIMPFQYSTVRLNSAGASTYVKLSPVQLPAVNSFDPAFDLLIGKPVLDIPAGEVAASYTIGGFKRMFAPFRIQIRDGGSLLGSEKIRTATLSFGQEPATAARQSLIGVFYFNLGSTFEDNDFLSMQAESMGNAVSALFPEGQAADAGAYPVWYIVNPTKFTAGTPVTLTVSTDTKTYTRTAQLSADREVAAGRMNNLGFNLTDDGVTAQESLTQDFSTGPVSNAGDYLLTASDGKQYTWTFTGSNNFRLNGKSDGSTLSDALRLANSEMTLPSVQGKRIAEIRVFTHVMSNATTSTSAVCNLSLYSGETLIQDYDYNYYNQNGSNLSKNGGVLTMAVPAQYRSAPLTIKGDAAAKFISAVTLILEDDTAPAITLSDQVTSTETTLTFGATLYNATSWKYICRASSEAAPDAATIFASGTEVSATSVTIEGLTAGVSYTLYAVALSEGGAYSSVATATGRTVGTDYLSLYLSGRDIEIGNQTYKLIVNKTTYPDYVHITSATADALAALKAGGLIFLDNDVVITNTDHIKLAGGTAQTIVIGVDPKAAQPKIKGDKQLYCNGSLLALKNVELSLTGDNGIVSAVEASATENCDIILDDCTYYYNKYGVTDIYRAASGRCIKNIIADNCIVKVNGASGAVVKGNIKDYTSRDFTEMKSISLTNNVFYATATTAHYLVEFGSNSAGYSFETSNLEVTVKNNTLFNLYVNRNIMVRTYKAAKMYFGYNVGYFDITGIETASTTYLLGDYAKGLSGELIVSEYNYLTTNNSQDDLGWMKKNHSNVSAYTDTTSTIDNQDVDKVKYPYTATDVDRGYFPADKTKVTWDAGASYDTKTWAAW